MPFAVTKPGGGFHSLWGWVKAPEGAFNFSRREDAEDHIKANNLIGALIHKFEPVTPGQPPRMAPFGLGGRNG